MKCFTELKQYGAESVLRREYGDLLMSTPESGYDVSLKIDLNKLPADKSKSLSMYIHVECGSITTNKKY